MTINYVVCGESVNVDWKIGAFPLFRVREYPEVLIKSDRSNPDGAERFLFQGIPYLSLRSAVEALVQAYQPN